MSSFVEDAVRRNMALRQAQKAFIERGLASAEAARKSGVNISAAAVQDKLARRLKNACKKLDLAK